MKISSVYVCVNVCVGMRAWQSIMEKRLTGINPRTVIYSFKINY